MAGIYQALDAIERASQRAANRYWTTDLERARHVKSQILKALMGLPPNRRWAAINKIGWLWANKWGCPR